MCTLSPLTFGMLRDRMPAGIVPLPYGASFERSVCTIDGLVWPGRPANRVAAAAAMPTNSRRESSLIALPLGDRLQDNIKMKHHPSPNFNDRPGGTPVDT